MSSSDESTLLGTWLDRTDALATTYERILTTEYGEDIDISAALTEACQHNPCLEIMLGTAPYTYQSVVTHPEFTSSEFLRRSSQLTIPKASPQMSINYWCSLENIMLLEQAIPYLEANLRGADSSPEQYAKVLSDLVYARTERFIFGLWRSHALYTQHQYQLTLQDYTLEVAFARNALPAVLPECHPQEAALIAYNLARILESSAYMLAAAGKESQNEAMNYYYEALEYYLFAVSVFHTSNDQGRRVFNAPHFIPHQREFWRCIDNAIRLALIASRKDVAFYLVQLVKYSRSPLSVFSDMGYIEYMPDPLLFAKASAQAGMGAPEVVRTG